EPILLQLTKHGIPVDNDVREAMGKELDEDKERVAAECQPHWPEALQKYHPATGYVRPPKDKTGLIQREFPELKVEGQSELVECTALRWCQKLPFNPGSWQQVLEYIKFRKHPVPKKYKSDKETTEETELLKLAKKTKDPMYPLVLEYRE